MVWFFFGCFSLHVSSLPYVFYMYCVFYVSFPETGMVEIDFVKVLSAKSYFVYLAFLKRHFMKLDVVKIVFC